MGAGRDNEYQHHVVYIDDDHFDEYDHDFDFYDDNLDIHVHEH